MGSVMAPHCTPNPTLWSHIILHLFSEFSRTVPLHLIPCGRQHQSPCNKQPRICWQQSCNNAWTFISLQRSSVSRPEGGTSHRNNVLGRELILKYLAANRAVTEHPNEEFMDKDMQLIDHKKWRRLSVRWKTPVFTYQTDWIHQVWAER